MTSKPSEFRENIPVEYGLQINDRRPTMADIPSRKPILTIEQQIEHLRRKGVSF